MRILHTSDWHLKDRLGRQDRTEDINRSLEQIARYLDDGAVDVMIVAGDIFREIGMRTDEVKDALVKMREIFLPFLKRGGSIIATLGNHDKEIYFEIMKAVLDMVTPVLPGSNNNREHFAGRIYFAPKSDILRLKDKKGKTVQFVLMPYPTGIYLLGEEGRNFKTLEEKNRAIQASFKKLLDMQKRSLDTALPSVLVSHLHIRGTELHGRFRLSESESVMFEPGDVPAHWSYAAFGHIHQAQEPLKGARHVRYSGSIERLDAGERGDKKSVVMFEIGDDNELTGEPEILPLETTEILDVVITDPKNEIQHLREKYPNAEKALVKYTLNYDLYEDNREEMCREIERVFPRWYDRNLIAAGAENAVSISMTAEKMRDVPGVVRKYLAMAPLSKEELRGEIIELAEKLMADEFSDGKEAIV